MIKEIDSCVYYDSGEKTLYTLKNDNKKAKFVKQPVKKVFKKDKKISDIEYLRNLDIFFERYEFENWNTDEIPFDEYDVVKIEYNNTFYYLSDQNTGETDAEIFSDLKRYFNACINGVPKPAVLSFHSFEGGGPEYSFKTEIKGIFTWYSRCVYNKPGHEQLCGAGYDIIYELYPLRKGRATAVITSGSPIVPESSQRITVIVDENLKIEYKFE